MPDRYSATTGDAAAQASTIAAGATGLGTSIRLDNTRVLGFIVGSAWVSAGLSWQVSLDGSTWIELKSPVDGNAVAHTVAASGAYYVDPAAFAAWPYIRPRSGTADSPVNQTGGATVTVVSYPL